MTTFTSENTNIARSDHSVFNFLTDFSNFEKLLPAQVSDWHTEGDHCSFNIQNMATLEMFYELKEPFNHIVMASEGKSPFKFNLHCFIQPANESSCNVKLELNASLNPLMKMMASKPLSNFINILGAKLKEVCESTLPEEGEHNIL